MPRNSQYLNNNLEPKPKKLTYKLIASSLVAFVAVFLVVAVFLSDSFKSLLPTGSMIAAVFRSTATSTEELAQTSPITEVITAPVITHVKTPKQVKAIYMSSWVAGSPEARERLVRLVDASEINTIVIDIKDSTGQIAFDTTDPTVNAEGCIEHRARDIQSFIDRLHKKNVYVIGRVAVFQDPCFVKIHPELAVKTLDGSKNWKDHKGIMWLDAGSKPVWDYVIKIARAGYDIGFDEINFDYIRFPSDGNLRDISFPQSGSTPKTEIVKNFFKYIGSHLHSTSTPEKNIPISADLFGLVTTSSDDLGIGQVLENALPYVDFVAPMVYPSHFAKTAFNLNTAWDHPYEVIVNSMGRAIERAKAIGEDPLKLRPWLQDFDLGAVYTPEMVRKQIQATYDVGLTSWMMWDASNRYSPTAYLPK